MTLHGPIRADLRWQEKPIRYSICTLVSRPAQYAEMVESFRSGGFDGPDCEFLYLDNSCGNAFDAYAGNNLFLSVARGELIILCHQDVLLLQEGRQDLDAVLDELTRQHPNWGACGNAGGGDDGQVAIRITDPHGVDQRIGPFPAKVQSLDENFIIVRRSANMGFSADLNGFHFYGTDICLIAEILGYSCYVIDFHIFHKSAGFLDKQFFRARDHLIRKYRRAFRARYVSTTCTTVYLSGLPLLGRFLNSNFASDLIERARRLRRLVFRA
jgi:hypothetical protein